MLVKIQCFPNKKPSLNYQFAMENDPFIGYLPVKMLIFHRYVQTFCGTTFF